MTKTVSTAPAPLQAEDESFPDSQIRPIKQITLSLRVSEALMGRERSAYLTLMLPDGTVLFEDQMPESGVLEVHATVPPDTRQIKALVEAGSMYRNATFTIGTDGRGSCNFA
jgi:hypothetical protein